MGLFSFTQELAMDLGTANSVIVNNAGKILLDEPSIVALDHKTDKMIALGEKARQMHGKTHGEHPNGKAVEGWGHRGLRRGGADDPGHDQDGQ